MRTTDFREDISSKTALIILTAAAVVLTFLCCMEIFVFSVLGAAAFAALCYFDKKRWYMLSAAVLSLAAAAVFDYRLLPAVCLTLSVGGCLTLFFAKGFSKFDAVFVSVLQFLLMFVFLLWMTAAQATGDVSPEAAISFYMRTMEEVKAACMTSFEETIHLYLGDDAQDMALTLETAVDSIFRRIPALFGVVSFVMAGCAAKLWTAFVSRWSADRGEAVRRWNFTTPMIFACFYGILTLLSLFFDAATDAFSLAVVNLQLFFMVVYAYIGFKYLRFSARRMRRRNPMIFFILVMFLFLPSLSLQLLAIEGMIAVISAYRLQKQRQQKYNDN